MTTITRRKSTVVALTTIIACAVALGFTPKNALATPHCTNDFYVYILIYGNAGTTSFSSDSCWTARRLIQYKSGSPLEHVWRICHYDPSKDDNVGAPRRVWNDTNSRTQDPTIEQNNMKACANDSPATNEIDIEYMAATTTSDPCNATCWWHVQPNFPVWVNEWFPELYWDPTIEVGVEPILNHWVSGDYNASPSSTAGTMADTPFLEQDDSNFYGDWPALDTDTLNLCQATQPGHDMSIYIGSGYPDVRNENPDSSFSHGHGTSDLIDEVDSTINSCVG